MLASRLGQLAASHSIRDALSPIAIWLLARAPERRLCLMHLAELMSRVLTVDIWLENGLGMRDLQAAPQQRRPVNVSPKTQQFSTQQSFVMVARCQRLLI